MKRAVFNKGQGGGHVNGGIHCQSVVRAGSAIPYRTTSGTSAKIYVTVKTLTVKSSFNW